MSYLGRSAKLSLKAQEKVSFLATAGQTSKTGLSYVPSFVEVYVNGVLITDTTDYTATNGNSITFTVALLLNDEVTVISLKTFTVADHYSKTEADTLLAAKATNTALALKAPIASPVLTGNVGVGVTPESSYAGRPTLRIGAGLAIGGYGSGNPSHHWISANSYQAASDATEKYIGADQASQLKQTNGTFTFNVAPNGNADAAISWTTAMTIDNDGRTGLSNHLDMSGILIYSGIGSGGKAIQTTASGSHSYSAGFFRNSSGTKVGEIVVGTSSTQFLVNSDYRLKENVTPMSGATAQTKLLKPCNFDWISDGSNVNGFLAHELAEVVPEAVTGTKDAMMDEEYEVTPATDTEAAVMGTRSVPDLQGIDQSKLVPLLTATIQELIARIEALEGE